MLIIKICYARLIFDPIFAKFGDFESWILQNCRGCRKPLYEAQDFNYNQISQSWHQIGDNLIQKSNFV